MSIREDREEKKKEQRRAIAEALLIVSASVVIANYKSIQHSVQRKMMAPEFEELLVIRDKDVRGFIFASNTENDDEWISSPDTIDLERAR